jgi:hypothetical protein
MIGSHVPLSGDAQHTALAGPPLSRKHAQKQAGEGKRLLSCSVVAQSTKDTSNCLVGHPIISSNLAQGFVVLTGTAHHLRPFFSRDAMLRLTWTWMLLFGYERGEYYRAFARV